MHDTQVLLSLMIITNDFAQANWRECYPIVMPSVVRTLRDIPLRPPHSLSPFVVISPSALRIRCPTFAVISLPSALRIRCPPFAVISSSPSALRIRCPPFAVIFPSPPPPNYPALPSCGIIHLCSSKKQTERKTPFPYAQTHSYLRPVTGRRRWQGSRARRLGVPPPRSWHDHLHRPARPLRRHPDRHYA